MSNSPQRALRPLLFYTIAILVFLSDQFSKWWMQRSLFYFGPSRPIIGNAFLLTLTQNTGGAWSLLPKGNSMFIVFAVFAVIALVVAYHNMRSVDLYVGAAFALALGGALGNLCDRIRYGYVVDFFDVRIIHFPIFNVADSGITLGIGLLLIHFARSSGDANTQVQAPVAQADSADIATSGPDEAAGLRR